MVTNAWSTQTDFDAGVYTDTVFDTDHVRLDNADSTSDARTESFEFWLEAVNYPEDTHWEYTVWDDDTDTQLATDSGTVTNLNSGHGGTYQVGTESFDIYEHTNLRIELRSNVDTRSGDWDDDGEHYFRVYDFNDDIIAELNNPGDLDRWYSDTDTHSYEHLLPFVTSGSWSSESRTINGWVTHDEIEVTATVPTNTTLELVIADGQGNTDRITINDGTNTYSTSGLSETDSLQVDADFSTSDDSVTPELYSFTVTSTLVVPSPLAVDATRATEVDLSWGDVTNEDSYDVYRATASGTTDADYTLVAQITDGTITHTDGSLTNGTEYFYRVRAVYPAGSSDLTAEVSTITDLPAPVFDSLTAGGEETTSQWTKQDNSGDGDWAILRSTDGSLGSEVAAPALPDREYTDTGLEGGETYYYTIRRRTPDATADSGQLSATPDLPPPGGLTADETQYDVRLVLEWTDDSTSNTLYRIERSPDGGATYTEVDVLGADAERYESPDLIPSADNVETYTYRVTTENDTTTESAEVSGSIEAIDYHEYWTLALRLNGNLKQLQNDDLTRNPSWRQEPSAKTSWNTATRWSPELEDWMRADAFLWFDGELLFRGEFHNPKSVDSDGITEINGADIVKKLERGGQRHVVTTEAGWKAIQNYVQNNLPGWNWTVHEPTPTQIDDQLTAQTASDDTELQDVFGADADTADKPATVSNGLHATQTCFTREAESFDRNSGGGAGSDANASDGAFRILQRNTGDWLEFDFTLEHDVDAADFEVHVRDAMVTSANNLIAQYDVYLDDTLVVNDYTVSRTEDEWQWSTHDSASDGFALSGTISAGTHTVRIQDAGGSNYENTGVDVIAPADGRFSYTLDNNVDADGYLSGPELYPDSVQVLGKTHNQAWNIITAYIDVVIDDTGGAQALAATNEGAADNPTFVEQANTASATLDVSATYGSVLQGRVTLSRYGSRSTATPTTGFNPQTITDWSAAIDTNDLPVIDDLEAVGSPYDILKDLHEAAGMIFTPEYHIDELRADSLEPGDVALSGDWKTVDFSRSPDTSEYANKLTVFGAKDETTGERLSATAEDADEINAVGEIEGPAEWRDRVNSGEQLRNIARVKLRSLVSKGALVGDETVVPVALRPGFAYESEPLDGSQLTLWAVDYTDKPGQTGTLKFTEPEDLAGQISGLSTEVRRTKE